MTYAGWNEDDHIRRERLAAITLFVLVILATLADVFQDYEDGSPLSHILGEFVIIGVALSAAIYLFSRLRMGWHTRQSALKSELNKALGDVEHWKKSAAALAQGLSAAIEQQLKVWQLSPAEQEVAFLLIKGMSLKEIAELRKTAERTVRQQAATIYKKSGLDGRAQLAAFFLEDLLPARG